MSSGYGRKGKPVIPFLGIFPASAIYGAVGVRMLQIPMIRERIKNRYDGL